MSAYDDIAQGLDEIFRSAFVSGSTKGSYKQKYRPEYDRVKAYVEGGAFPSPFPTALMGSGLTKVERGRRALEPEPPPPTPSNYLDSFYDFYNSGGGGWLLNRWNTGTPAQDPYSEPQETGTPWANGGGIFEVATPVGNGFKFVCTGAMTVQSGGKMVLISDWNDHLGQIGSIEDWSFKVMFPSAGNPNGFITTSNHVGLVWEWHETHSGTNISVAGERTPREWKFAYHDESKVAANPSNYNAWLVPVYTNVVVEWDRWYTWRVRKRDATSNTGMLQVWLDGVQYIDLQNWRTLHTAPPWLQFGFYSHDQPPITNEVHIAAITLSVT